MPITGAEIVKLSGGTLVQGDPEELITGFSIDSRQTGPGDFFVPLRGDREDGHRYVQDALERGAAGSFYARHPLPAFQPGKLIVAVPETLPALQKLAAGYRRRFNIPVIGVTGSSGKTTTKDYIAGVLAKKLPVLKTAGNLNNEIGLPLTILTLEGHHQAAVVEMGMSAPGEIGVLAEVARPVYGVITNIGEAHLEHLGSIEAIAAAKGELLDYLGAEGIAILNGDDPYLQKLGERFAGKVYYYGFEKGLLELIELSIEAAGSFFRLRFPDGQEHDFSLPLPGRHLVSNAMAAITVGYLFGLSPPDISAGLRETRLTGGRLQFIKSAAGVVLIDDTYNANPASVRASLQVLADLAGERGVAVLGDMLELGPAAAEMHRELGRFAAALKIGGLVAVGELAREAAAGARESGLPAAECSSQEEALALLAEMPLSAGCFILVKGSRGMQLEVLVARLLQSLGGEKK